MNPFPIVAMVTAAGLLVLPAGCDRESERAGVSPKLVERADEAAEQTRRTVTDRAAHDIHDVAVEELDHRLYSTDKPVKTVTDAPMEDLRRKIDEVQVAQSDYIAARDRVVAQAREHLQQLWAQANQPNVRADREQLRALHRQAQAKLELLAAASAREWDERSEEAFEAVDALDDQVDQAADARRRARQKPNDPDLRNAPLRP